MPDRLIELKDVAKSYGRVFAVGGVNFHVDRGEVVGLIGDNGAGKSTLIKMLAGAIQPTSGQIFARGVLQTHWSAARSRDAGIETVFQDRALCVQQTIVYGLAPINVDTGAGFVTPDNYKAVADLATEGLR